MLEALGDFFPVMPHWWVFLTTHGLLAGNLVLCIEILRLRRRVGRLEASENVLHGPLEEA